MAKIYGVHEIGLRPGVKEEDFEKFFLEEMATAPQFPGWSWRLLKGDRGVRAGRYLLLFEIDSVQARDRIAPPSTPNKLTKEAEQFNEKHKAALDAIFKSWEKFSSTDLLQNPNFTDYIVVGK